MYIIHVDWSNIGVLSYIQIFLFRKKKFITAFFKPITWLFGNNWTNLIPIKTVIQYDHRKKELIRVRAI